MAEHPMGGEKTEKPTAKRLSEARKNGDLLQSKELSTALVVMAGIGWLAVSGPAIMGALSEMLKQALRFDKSDIAGFAPAARSASLVSEIALPVAGILGITLLAAIAAPAMLGSLGFRASAIGIKPSKMNPANGLKRIFGLQGIMELLKSMAKVGLLGSIGLWVVWGKLTEIVGLGRVDFNSAIADLGGIFLFACLVMAASLFVIAGIDVPSQIMQRGKRLAMTKQEVKDEYKDQEGSPEAKGQIRRRMMESLNASARKAVAEASVIIMNPTHFAVALRYQPGVDTAPIVVARGRDDLALAIRNLADEKQVPVLQYPELARAIYFTSRAGQIVDEALYMAVATVLAFVFRVENRMATEMDRPFIVVPEELRFNADGRKIIN